MSHEHTHSGFCHIHALIIELGRQSYTPTIDNVMPSLSVLAHQDPALTMAILQRHRVNIIEQLSLGMPHVQDPTCACSARN